MPTTQLQTIDHAELNGEVKMNAAIEALNQLLDGEDIVDGGNVGITALNGFDVSNCHYWYKNLGKLKRVYLAIELNPTGVLEDYYQMIAAQVPDSIKPLQMISQTTPRLKYSDGASSDMYVSLDVDAKLYVGISATSNKLSHLAGFHAFLTYLANN